MHRWLCRVVRGALPPPHKTEIYVWIKNLLSFLEATIGSIPTEKLTNELLIQASVILINCLFDRGLCIITQSPQGTIRTHIPEMLALSGLTITF